MSPIDRGNREYSTEGRRAAGRRGAANALRLAAIRRHSGRPRKAENLRILRPGTLLWRIRHPR